MTEATEKTHVYVATPAYSCLMHTAFVRSLLQLQGLCMKRGIAISVDLIGNESLVQRARNVLQARFLKSEATHLLFIDSDIAFQPDSVVDKLLPADRDVITGIYAKKSINWPAIERKVRTNAMGRESIQEAGLDYNLNIIHRDAAVANGVIEVLDSATGFMMIKRDVIERMWAEFADTLMCVNDIQGHTNVTAYCAIFDCMIDPESKRYLSEDYAFCRRWQSMGGSIHAHVGVPLAHIGSHPFEGDIRARFGTT